LRQKTLKPAVHGHSPSCIVTGLWADQYCMQLRHWLRYIKCKNIT